MPNNMTREEASRIKRKTIYDTGMDLFREYGYEQTTLEDICVATGMSRGSLYYFYPKKRDILYHFFEEMMEISLKYLEQADENIADPGAAILEYTVRVAAANESLGYDLACVLQNTYHEEREDDRFNQRYVQCLKEFIDAAQKAGTFKNDITASEAAHCIHIASAGVFRKWILEEGQFSLEDATRWFMPFIINRFISDDQQIHTKREFQRWRV